MTPPTRNDPQKAGGSGALGSQPHAHSDATGRGMSLDPAGRLVSAVRYRQATMRDVAQVAGVSLKTVSRVVNMEASVRPEMERRVEDAIVALGFRRNVAARSLRTGGRIGSSASEASRR